MLEYTKITCTYNVIEFQQFVSVHIRIYINIILHKYTNNKIIGQSTYNIEHI